MRATVEPDVKGLSISEGWETAPRGAHARDGPEVLAGMAATSVWGLMSADFWLGLQLDWDLWHALRSKSSERIAGLEPLRRTG